MILRITRTLSRLLGVYGYICCNILRMFEFLYIYTEYEPRESRPSEAPHRIMERNRQPAYESRPSGG